MSKYNVVIISIIWVFMTTKLMAQYDLQLKAGFFETEENVNEYLRNSSLSAIDEVDGYYYRFIQFNEMPNADLQREIQASKVALLSYVPNLAYIAAFPSSFDEQKLLNWNVRFVTKIPKDWKINKKILENRVPDWAITRESIALLVQYYKNLEHSNVLSYLRYEGAEIISNNDIDPYFHIRIPIHKLDDIYDLPFLSYIDLCPAPDIKDDHRGRALHRSNVLDRQVNGLQSYTGEGVAVCVRDDGAVGPHIDFKGRINQDYAGPSSGNHGDGVAGIFAGAGNLDPRNRGMAAGAEIFILDYQSDFLDETMMLHNEHDVIVTNSSYSNGCNAGYTMTTSIVDGQTYENPTLMHVFSAGNSNNLDCDYGAGSQWGNITGGHKQGKNVVTTANVEFTGNLSVTSSRGPAHDGRIKPDISAHGTEHYSTGEDNNYISFGGTSAAAPGIAGVLAQLHEQYRLKNNKVANGALLKAIILNTANDLGNIGPDFLFGWGHVNVYKASKVIEEERYFTSSIQAGETKTFSIDVADNVKELKVMTYWSDPPADVMSEKALVNDLNTYLVDESNELYKPYVLIHNPDPIMLNAPALKGDDFLNNMEQVSIINPQGSYDLNVVGSTIPFMEHEFHVVIEYIYEAIEIIYPLEGDQFLTSQTEVLHWDAIPNGEAYEISIRENENSNWLLVNNADEKAILVTWNVPNNWITNKAQFRIKRGQEEVLSDFLTFTPEVVNIKSNKFCPEFLSISWDAIESATSYDVFALGDKYMEKIITVDTTFAEIPIDNPFDDQWIAVSANFDNGIIGRRSKAEFVAGDGLINCQQEVDIRINAILSPRLENGLFCQSPFEGNLLVQVENTGMTDLDSFVVQFQVNGGLVVSQKINEILVSEALMEVLFDDPIVFSVSGVTTITVSVETTDDQFQLDNIIDLSADIYLESGEAVPFMEDFENIQDLPHYWSINNPDDSYTWTKRSVIQSNFEPGQAMSMPFYDYFESGKEDELSTIPLDLTGLSGDNFLSFDLAYSPFLNNYETLIIEVSTDCGESFGPPIYEKTGLQLQTVQLNDNFIPFEMSHWRGQAINISDYIGLDKVIFKFKAISKAGNNLYIDNINIGPLNLSAPVAEFFIVPFGFCLFDRLDMVSFSQGEFLDYEWDFGEGAIPAFAYAEGPHELYYSSAGEKEITLIVSNASGADTLRQTINIKGSPTGDWTVSGMDMTTVSFDAEYLFAESYEWDFGDGEMSEEEDPTHTFAASGSYGVTLRITNECQSFLQFREIEVDISSTAESRLSQISISPNPSSGRIYVKSEVALETQDLKAFDALGREIFIQVDKIENGLIVNIEEKEFLGIMFLKYMGGSFNFLEKILIHQ